MHEACFSASCLAEEAARAFFVVSWKHVFSSKAFPALRVVSWALTGPFLTSLPDLDYQFQETIKRRSERFDDQLSWTWKRTQI